MAIYDQVPLRAIRQENLWDGGGGRGEGWLRRRKANGWRRVAGKQRWRHEQPENKGHTVCAEREGREEVFPRCDSAVQETAGVGAEGWGVVACMQPPAFLNSDITSEPG